MLQGYSCLSGVKTYLLALCSRAAGCLISVAILSAGHCAAGVQLFMRCRNLSADTVMQGCSCLSGVKTYLPALCCRDAAV